MPMLGTFTDNPKLDALAYKMFREFSRMEYALKAIQCFENARSAQAGWDRFADNIDIKIREKVLTDLILRDAVDFLVDKPPKRQVQRGGRIEWDDKKPNSKSFTGLILQYVKRVRNNLFHGGKFNGHWLDPERSEPLISNALIVLRACREVCNELREAYEH